MATHRSVGGGWLRGLWYMIGSATAVVLLFGCAGGGAKPMAADNNTGQASDAAASGGDADKFLIVDCLLPPQVKKLGTNLTFLAPRRPVKTSAAVAVEPSNVSARNPPHTVSMLSEARFKLSAVPRYPKSTSLPSPPWKVSSPSP